MVIGGWRRGKPMSIELEAAAAAAVQNLEELSHVLGQARVPVSRENVGNNYVCLPKPRVLSYMSEAVLSTGDLSLTPMAAVAGSIADLTVEVLIGQGATKAFANNGGDIAVKMIEDEKTEIGIISSLATGRVSHSLTITGRDHIGGIATSGLGGRGLSKGIADAVVVLAENARLADACATVIANETYVDTPEVLQVKAEILDPQTDIAEQMVTKEVYNLPSVVIKKALKKGKESAMGMIKKGIIQGAYIFVQGQMATVPEFFQTKARHLKVVHG
jgi:ApbE superfamily uncharacterized protein (UPF0280 family)